MNHLESGVIGSSPENEEGDGNGVVTDCENNINQKQAKRKKALESQERNTLRRREKELELLAALIPNCDKRDPSSIIDAAIAYIKKRQLQLKAMRSGFPFTWEQIPHDQFHTYLHLNGVPVIRRNGMGIMMPRGCIVARATQLKNQESNSTSGPSTQTPPPE